MDAWSLFCFLHFVWFLFVYAFPSHITCIHLWTFLDSIPKIFGMLLVASCCTSLTRLPQVICLLWVTVLVFCLRLQLFICRPTCMFTPKSLAKSAILSKHDFCYYFSYLGQLCHVMSTWRGAWGGNPLRVEENSLFTKLACERLVVYIIKWYFSKMLLILV